MLGTFVNPTELTIDELTAQKVQLETFIDIYYDAGKIAKANQVRNCLKEIQHELDQRKDVNIR